MQMTDIIHKPMGQARTSKLLSALGSRRLLLGVRVFQGPLSLGISNSKCAGL